jgi:hypothetical protein
MITGHSNRAYTNRYNGTYISAVTLGWRPRWRREVHGTCRPAVRGHRSAPGVAGLPPALGRDDAVRNRRSADHVCRAAAGLRHHPLAACGRRYRGSPADPDDHHRATRRRSRRRHRPAQARAGGQQLQRSGLGRACRAGVRRLALSLAALRSGRGVGLVQRDQLPRAANVHSEPAPCRPGGGGPGAEPAELSDHADCRPGAGRPDRGGTGPRPARVLSRRRR